MKKSYYEKPSVEVIVLRDAANALLAISWGNGTETKVAAEALWHEYYSNKDDNDNDLWNFYTGEAKDTTSWDF